MSKSLCIVLQISMKELSGKKKIEQIVATWGEEPSTLVVSPIALS